MRGLTAELIRHRRGRVLLPPQLPELSPAHAIAIAMQLYEAGVHAARWREENEAIAGQDGDAATSPDENMLP